MTDSLLTCKNLVKSYGGVQAVREVSLSVEAGTIVGLVGPNGAGKTTMVDLITGQQQADSGEIQVAGHRLTGPPSRRARSAGFARTFQHPQLAPELTVRENLLLGTVSTSMGTLAGVLRRVCAGIFTAGAGVDEDHIRRMAESLSIEDLSRKAADLTLGEQRLVEVARAMLRGPQILLLDEPFAGGDSAGIEAMTDALGTVLDRGCGVLLVDHNIDLVASLAQRIVLMDRGRVVYDGTAKEAMASEEMRDVYFGEHHE